MMMEQCNAARCHCQPVIQLDRQLNSRVPIGSTQRLRGTFQWMQLQGPTEHCLFTWYASMCIYAGRVDARLAALHMKLVAFVC